MAPRKARLSIKQVEQVPEVASVCDFDEVEEPLQSTISDANDRGATTVSVDSAQAELVDECDHEVVKFINYYRVSRV